MDLEIHIHRKEDTKSFCNIGGHFKNQAYGKSDAINFATDDILNNDTTFIWPHQVKMCLQADSDHPAMIKVSSRPVLIIHTFCSIQ